MPQPRAKTREELKAQIAGRRMSDSVGVKKSVKPKTEQQKIIAKSINGSVRKAWAKFMSTPASRKK